ncbi:DUF4190 domain-containing protein [Paeniglutamicibacter sp. NPDC091659]|uniref:DUF4190 domain-containing protein n=1 Tax=Paeniglutamicibacter sp. NPDC091659 TaxID=3364389 RepID=UPI0037F3FB7E
MITPRYPAPDPQPRGYGSGPDKTNPLAIAALAASFVIGLTGVVLGHIALHQIKPTRERDRGLAITALLIGYASTAAGAYLIAGLFSATGDKD